MATSSKTAVKRYGLAVLSFAVTLLIYYAFFRLQIRFDLSLLIFAALIVTAWYGGRGPGLTSAILFEIAATVTVLYSRRPSGQPIPWGRLVISEFNFLALFVFLVLLVSARRNIEAKLREQREWLQVTLASIGDAVIATDLNGMVTLMNPTAEKLTGWKLSDATNRPLRESFNIINEESRAIVENPVSKVIRDGVTVGLANHTILVSKDGREQPIDDSGAPIRNHKGQITGVVLVFRDVTERKLAEHEREELLSREKLAREQAETASRIKDEFLATVSHELRTPLTAMLGWSRLLRDNRLDKEATKRAIEVIDRNASSQAQIVNDLLEMSRIITGKMRLELRPIDVSRVTINAVETLKPAAEAKGIKLEVDVPETSIQVKGDSDRLQQVLWNLLSNAIRFTPHGGSVKVQVSKIESQVEVVVSDTGIGINQQFLPYVFDRFQQADSSITRKYGGLGLGLAIVRSLVELHGGTVRAESPGEGLGTIFTVRLPEGGTQEIEDDQAVPARGVRAVSHESAGLDHRIDLSGLRVLVVDDETDALELISVVLGQYGAEVRTSTSAGLALPMISEWRPNVLVSDIGMPDEDGYVFIRKVRSLTPEQGGRVPAAALTAFARSEDRLRVLAAGFQTHVTKPVDPKEIASVVSSLASRVYGTTHV